jgi:cupin fold WbuC family metalloprotein
MSTPFPLSLPPVQGDIFQLDADNLRRGIEASRASPRGRIMLRMNRTETEGVQRLVNFLQAGSYIRPHRHPMAECVENIAMIQGEALFLVFDEVGRVTSRHHLIAGRADACMVDLAQGPWHTLLPLVDDTVVLEIKRGPYDAKTDKEFAAWSPMEGTAEAAEWVKIMTKPCGEV